MAPQRPLSAPLSGRGSAAPGPWQLVQLGGAAPVQGAAGCALARQAGGAAAAAGPQRPPQEPPACAPRPQRPQRPLSARPRNSEPCQIFFQESVCQQQSPEGLPAAGPEAPCGPPAAPPRPPGRPAERAGAAPARPRPRPQSARATVCAAAAVGGALPSERPGPSAGSVEGDLGSLSARVAALEASLQLAAAAPRPRDAPAADDLRCWGAASRGEPKGGAAPPARAPPAESAREEELRGEAAAGGAARSLADSRSWEDLLRRERDLRLAAEARVRQLEELASAVGAELRAERGLREEAQRTLQEESIARARSEAELMRALGAAQQRARRLEAARVETEAKLARALDAAQQRARLPVELGPRGAEEARPARVSADLLAFVARSEAEAAGEAAAPGPQGPEADDGRWQEAQDRHSAELAARAAKQIQLLPQAFLVDNSALKATTDGIAYRLSKQEEHRTNEKAAWGTVVLGVDQGDGWLLVGSRYLPFHLKGATVLTPLGGPEEPATPGAEGPPQRASPPAG